jgi:hypothetical protein
MLHGTGIRLQGALLLVAVLMAMPLVSFAQTTSYDYDELNRLKRTGRLDGTVVDYSYDNASNRTAVVQSLDTTVPTGTIAINSGASATNNTSVTLTLTCTDDTGCFQMQFSNDGINYSAPEHYVTGKT